jgi:hypothetical protein
VRAKVEDGATRAARDRTGARRSVEEGGRRRPPGSCGGASAGADLQEAALTAAAVGLTAGREKERQNRLRE